MPTFGNTSAGDRSQSIMDTIVGSRFICPETCQPDSITALVSADDPSLRIKCAIYRRSDGKLMATTEEKTNLSSSFSWVTFNVNEPKPTLSGGIEYYLVAWGDGFYDPWTHLYYETWIRYSLNNNGAHQSQTYDDWPDPWSPTETADRVHSIYCTYTPVAVPVKKVLGEGIVWIG